MFLLACFQQAIVGTIILAMSCSRESIPASARVHSIPFFHLIVIVYVCMCVYVCVCVFFCSTLLLLQNCGTAINFLPLNVGIHLMKLSRVLLLVLFVLLLFFCCFCPSPVRVPRAAMQGPPPDHHSRRPLSQVRFKQSVHDRLRRPARTQERAPERVR